MIRFILNKKEIQSSLPPGTLLLDFIRYHQHEMGTKIGCREGDCGACTVLIGKLRNGRVHYTSATSCLTAIGNVHGLHVVTVEGLNLTGLNLVQQAFSDESASQCGFCTPGFVVALAGFTLSGAEPTMEKALEALSGNICRCTGYKSIEKAAARVCRTLEAKGNQDPVEFAVGQGHLPAYFNDIPSRLLALQQTLNGALLPKTERPRFLGGGTDLYVQQHDTMPHTDIDFLFHKPVLNGIEESDGICTMGAACTVTDMLESPVFKTHFPDLKAFGKLISSTPIRNIATIAGNFVNASPIGDLSIFFLALDARLLLSNGQAQTWIPLREFYLGYKKLAKDPDQYVEKISFRLPSSSSAIHFEKVCKRTHLDIASVNSACFVDVQNGIITQAGLSAGGVGPVPMFLVESSRFLEGKPVSEDLLEPLIERVQQEISPISDVRGTAAYKRRLLIQQMKGHFLALFKGLNVQKVLEAAS